MTILAYKADDAVSLIKTFDDTHQVHDEQIVDIVLDLDSWNQESDGVIELQGFGQDERAKLSEIIHQRTGLSYQQAPKFYDKIEQAFLDRRIPMFPGEAAVTQGDATSTVAGSAVGSVVLTSVVPVSAEALESVTGRNDYHALGRLIDEVKTAEQSWAARLNKLPLPSFHQKLPPLNKLEDAEYVESQLQQCRALREALVALRNEAGQTENLLKQVGEEGKAHLGHGGLKDAMKVMAYRKEMLREMIGHYGKTNEIRPADTRTLQVYLSAARQTNQHLVQVARSLPTVVLPPRAVAAAVPQAQTAFQSLRAAGSRFSDVFSLAKAARGAGSLANGVRTFLAPARAWVNQSGQARAVAPVAAALAVGGLVFLAVDLAADAGPKPQKEIEFVKPERKTETLKSDSKASPGPGPDGTWKIEDLPAETWQISDLPQETRTPAKPRKTAAK